MKTKKLALLFCFFSFVTAAHALDDFSFSIEPEFGFLNGIIFENVWYANTKNTATETILTPTTRQSRLDWQFENSPYYGADIQTLFYNHYLIEFDFINAIPGEFGVMEDYDWKIKAQPDHLTNYSIHLNYIKAFTNFNFNFGLVYEMCSDFPIFVTLKFGINYYNFDLCGKGGYRLYEEENWTQFYWDIDDLVIEYKQQYVAPRISFDLDYHFTKHFETKLGAGVEYKNEYNAFDLHESRGRYYKDNLKNAWFFDGKLQLFFKINKMHKIGLKGTLNYMPDTYALTYISKTSINEFPDEPDGGGLGGTSRFLWTYGLTYTFTF